MPKMSAQEIEWQSQEDVRTLTRYDEIMMDSARKNRAYKEASKQAKELNKRANTLSGLGKRRK